MFVDHVGDLVNHRNPDRSGRNWQIENLVGMAAVGTFVELRK
jgi:post-segregation antitoxin (ccd killing protein)